MSAQSRIWVVIIGPVLLLILASAPVSAQAGGTLVCWGDNSFGQCNVSSGLTGLKAVAGGGGTSLALKSDGTVVCSGDNSFGQCNVPAGLGGVTAVAGSASTSMALKSDGTVVCWGDNSFGQCNVPADLSGVTAIVTNPYFGLVLKNNGTVLMWGFAGWPYVPPGLSGVTAIAAGQYHILALRSDGTVVAGGCPTGYDLGQCTVPAGLSGITAIAAGLYFSLALKSDGTVVGWGDNSFGQLPTGISGVTAIASGWYHSMALKSDGTVVARGLNTFGQTNVPAGLRGVTSVAAGSFQSLAIKAPPNWAPVAQNVTVTTNENTSAQVTLSATDQDSSDTLTYLLVAPPQHGKLTMGTPGSYTPDLNYTGTDTFQYRAYDGKALSNVANGTITVGAATIPRNNPPVAQTDSSTVTMGTKVTINVLANDSDPDGDPLTLVGVTQASHGKVTISANNTLTYTPRENFVGTDMFSYTISDGRGGTATATVTVERASKN